MDWFGLYNFLKCSWSRDTIIVFLFIVNSLESCNICKIGVARLFPRPVLVFCCLESFVTVNISCTMYECRTPSLGKLQLVCEYNLYVSVRIYLSINRCKSDIECIVREAFLIQKLSPSMNLKLYQGGALISLKIFS